MSRLLHLSHELRVQIWQAYFSSLTLYLPLAKAAAASATSLELLQTSRDIHDECQGLCWKYSTCHFADTEAFLDHLTRLPPSTLKLLRYVTIRKATQLCLLDATDPRRFNSWPFPLTLSLLPGLALQTLVLGDAFHGADVARHAEFWSPWVADRAQYQLVSALVASDGWKTCCVQSATVELLTWDEEEAGRFHPLPDDEGVWYGRRKEEQPRGWNGELWERDGEAAETGVEILQKRADVKGAQWLPLNEEYTTATAPAEGHMIRIDLKRGTDDCRRTGRPLQDGVAFAGGPRLSDVFAGTSYAELKQQGRIWHALQNLSACIK